MLKKYINIYPIFLIVAIVSSTAFAQDHEPEEVFKHNRVSLTFGHTHIPRGSPSVTNGSSLVVPSWGLNYEYWFTRKWALGLHNDTEIATYIVEDNTGSTIERERPVIVSIVGIYNPWKGLEFVAGFGHEFETHQSFWVYRVGIEYEIEFGHHWDLGPAFVVDIKENFYDSFTLAIVIGKRF